MNKKYLASNNTTSGFVNKFENINLSKDGFTFILKGGPGTGKSSLMKRVGKYFEDKNEFVEYFYCSSDSSSLDGVRVRRFSIVDGTAPHVTEATIPQVKEKIVNVGAYIGEGVRENKKEIEKLLKIKGNYFKKAYLFLESLGKIFEEELLSNKQDKNLDKFDFILEKLKNCKGIGLQRELFCSYLTFEGYKNLYRKNNYKEIIVLKGNFIENKKLFEKVVEYLANNKIDYIKFNSLFLPKETEGIYINKKDTLIICEDTYFESFSSFKNKVVIKQIIKKIAQNLDRAKKNHLKVEKFYVKNMDFDGVKKEEEKIIKEIELKTK